MADSEELDTKSSDTEHEIDQETEQQALDQVQEDATISGVGSASDAPPEATEEESSPDLISEPAEPEVEEVSEEVIAPILPSYFLVRGDLDVVIADEFQPTDLVTLIVQPTGKSMQTYVRMIDNRDQYRYHGKSGGGIHKFVFRLQDTRTYGTWKLLITAPAVNTEEPVEMEIPFPVVEDYSEEDLIEVSIVDAPTGYYLMFHDQEEEMFKLVESTPVPPVEEEIPEEIIEAEPAGEEIIELPIEEVAEESPVSEIGFTNTDLPDLKIPVDSINGIGPAYKKRLGAQNIEFVHQLVGVDPEALSELINVSAGKCNNWITMALDIANNPENSIYLEFARTSEEVEVTPEVAEKLDVDVSEEIPKIPVVEIKGIGKTYQKKLNAKGVEFVHQLLSYSSSELSALTGISEKVITKWMTNAKDLV